MIVATPMVSLAFHLTTGRTMVDFNVELKDVQETVPITYFVTLLNYSKCKHIKIMKYPY